MKASNPLSFQDLILTLHDYWSARGCVILQPYDVEVGAGTLHPATVLRALGPKPWRAAYVQPSRRPSDGRYGENPNRLHQYHQYQVILKPNPAGHAGALSRLAGGGRHRSDAARHPLRRGRLGEPHRRRLGPGLGGLVRRHGGHPVHLLPAGRRPGRLAGGGRADLRAGAAGALCPGRRQRLRPAFNDPQSPDFRPMATSSWRTSASSPPSSWRSPTSRCSSASSRTWSAQVPRLLASAGRQGQPLVLPAYDHVLKASHLFNLMDARGAIAVAERQSYIGRIRDLCKACAQAWVALETAGGLSACLSSCSNCSARKSPRACRPARRATWSGWRASAWPQAALAVRASCATFAGPRRLTLVVDGLPPARPTAARSARARASARRTQALDGFLRSTGLARDDLDRARRRLFRHHRSTPAGPPPRSSPRWSRRSCAPFPGPSR